MSLYDLATSSAKTAEPILIIKKSANSDLNDPQNTMVFTSTGNGASIVLSPFNPQLEADDMGQPNLPVVINAQTPEIKTALTKIARFIPTETVTIYLGAISASVALQTTVNWLTPQLVYWVTGIGLTPLIFFLIWAIERTKTKKLSFSEFPYWKLSAAILAFLIWALAVPGNPYVTSDVAKMAVAFAALVISIFLDLIDQFFEARKLNTAT
jgi:hypothetical protein